VGLPSAAAPQLFADVLKTDLRPPGLNPVRNQLVEARDDANNRASAGKDAGLQRRPMNPLRE